MIFHTLPKLFSNDITIKINEHIIQPDVLSYSSSLNTYINRTTSQLTYFSKKHEHEHEHDTYPHPLEFVYTNVPGTTMSVSKLIDDIPSHFFIRNY